MKALCRHIPSHRGRRAVRLMSEEPPRFLLPRARSARRGRDRRDRPTGSFIYARASRAPIAYVRRASRAQYARCAMFPTARSTHATRRAERTSLFRADNASRRRATAPRDRARWRRRRRRRRRRRASRDATRDARGAMRAGRRAEARAGGRGRGRGRLGRGRGARERARERGRRRRREATRRRERAGRWRRTRRWRAGRRR